MYNHPAGEINTTIPLFHVTLHLCYINSVTACALGQGNQGQLPGAESSPGWFLAHISSSARTPERWGPAKSLRTQRTHKKKKRQR